MSNLLHIYMYQNYSTDIKLIFPFPYSHSRKSSSLSSSPVISKSTRHHIEEIEQTLSTNRPVSRNKLSLSPNRALLKGRGLLQQGSTHPPALSYTRSLMHVYLNDCSVTTLCLAPKTHPSRQDYLVIAQTTCGKSDAATTGGGGVAMGVAKLPPELLSEFDSILCSSGESVSLKERREWWGARAKLDKQLKVRLSTTTPCNIYNFLSRQTSKLTLVDGVHQSKVYVH